MVALANFGQKSIEVVDLEILSKPPSVRVSIAVSEGRHYRMLGDLTHVWPEPFPGVRWIEKNGAGAVVPPLRGSSSALVAIGMVPTQDGDFLVSSLKLTYRVQGSGTLYERTVPFAQKLCVGTQNWIESRGCAP
jgi:hypothetical protein